MQANVQDYFIYDGISFNFWTYSFSSLKLHSATDEDAEDVMIHYPQGAALVETLKICSSSLTDKALFNLLDHLQSLQDLELMSCNEITEDGLNAALPKKLRRLVISDCIHVADVSVSYVGRNLICLNSFEIQVSLHTLKFFLDKHLR